MDIALDANILIADPWLRSQSMRALLDFVRKTQSRILLSQVVEDEVRAHLQRQFTSEVAAVGTALKKAARHGVVGLPELSDTEALQATITKWETNFKTQGLPRGAKYARSKISS